MRVTNVGRRTLPAELRVRPRCAANKIHVCKGGGEGARAHQGRAGARRRRRRVCERGGGGRGRCFLSAVMRPICDSLAVRDSSRFIAATQAQEFARSLRLFIQRISSMRNFGPLRQSKAFLFVSLAHVCPKQQPACLCCVHNAKTK